MVLFAQSSRICKINADGFMLLIIITCVVPEIEFSFILFILYAGNRLQRLIFYIYPATDNSFELETKLFQKIFLFYFSLSLYSGSFN